MDLVWFPDESSEQLSDLDSDAEIENYNQDEEEPSTVPEYDTVEDQEGLWQT